jgi:tetratricopeptide (TPR) repeat protein
MESLLFIALLGAFIAVTADLLQQLPTPESRSTFKWLIQWCIKGALAPVLVWIVFNLGIFERLPDFVSSKMLEKMGGAHGNAELLMIFVGVIVICTYWTALTSGWLLVIVSTHDVDNKAVFKEVRWILILLSPLAILIVASFGWAALGVAGTIWLLPVVRAAANATNEVTRRIRPSYSKAAAELHRGKYEAAEQEIIAELERCEDDFDGWMLLAELYANQFHDLPAAQRMIEETCDQPTTTISEVAVAYHRLADWYLKLEGDPGKAIAALERICARYPKTHVERMAQLRIRRISGEKPEKRNEPRTIALPSQATELELKNVPNGAGDIDAAAAQARRCTEILRKDPNDIRARETFARLLAEKLGKADVGIEQLQMLIDLSANDESTAVKVAEWFGLIAAWQLKYLNDEEAAVATMKRLIHEHPQTAHAFSANRRLQMIEMERRLRSNRAFAPVGKTG